MSRVLVLRFKLPPFTSRRDQATVRKLDFFMRQTFPRRPLRLPSTFGSPVYFITFCTYRRRPILATHAIHDEFIRFCQNAVRDHNVFVGRYVIMPDHLHFFVAGDLNFHVGKWIRSLKQALGKKISLAKDHSRIWQEGFFDHALRSDESMAQKWDYIRENPVQAGLVSDLVNWPYQGEIALIDRT